MGFLEISFIFLTIDSIGSSTISLVSFEKQIAPTAKTKQMKNVLTPAQQQQLEQMKQQRQSNRGTTR